MKPTATPWTLNRWRVHCQMDGDCWIHPSTNYQALADARRKVFALAGGRIQNGLELTYTCEHRRCINPEHSKPMTRGALMKLHRTTVPLEAKLRMARAKRATAPKLTMDKAREIRAARCAGEHPLTVAKRFGVSRKMVWMVENNRAWKDTGLFGGLAR